MREITPKSKPELLAPVQDFTNLTCAVNNGCDAVYFGLDVLNMRQAARNFTVDDLPEIAARCAPRGIKKYLTLNVTLFDHDRPTAERLLDAAAGRVDAVICCDPGVIHLCRARGIPFHISTQASVSNSLSAEFYRSLGAERIVLARECALEDIRGIRETVDIELETFVHGAMCVSYSGRCFLSQFTSGKSGNRGACLQNCRRRYRVIDETDPENEFELGSDFIMSAKDLCALPFLDKLIEAGIHSFKIEGRNRNPQYVAETTACYREAIDSYFSGTFDDDRKTTLVKRLKKVYNRQFSSGFYMGRPIETFSRVDGSVAELQKRFVGVVRNYFAKIGVAEILVQDSVFSAGDLLAIEGPTTGLVQFTAESPRQDERPVKEVARGLVTLKVPARVRTNDRVFRLDRRVTFNNGR
ncbi:MAG: peptidase U32 family protein [Lentisphaeria bacterium]|nr:peptidase U32 family protein [Lentisphaeria bacterium]